MTEVNIEPIWKDVPGYGGHYQVSSLGGIRTKSRIVTKRHRSGKLIKQSYKPRVLSPYKCPSGHLIVHLGHNGKKHNLFVHRLVLLTFVGDAPDGYECCHNNGVACDNRLENLRWDTHFNNNQDRKKHGTYPSGESHPMSKLTEIEVMEIYNSNEPLSILAKKYDVFVTIISRIRLGHIWGAVTGGKPRRNIRKERENEKRDKAKS